MAISIVQQTAKGGAGAGPQTYTLNGCTAGNTLVLQCNRSDALTSVIQEPNGWKVIFKSPVMPGSGRFVSAAAFFLPNISAGTNSVILNIATSFQDAIMYEVSGLGTNPQVDVVAAGGGTSSPINSGTTNSTTQAIALAVASMAWDDNGTSNLGLSSGGTGSWTQLYADVDTNVANAGSALYQILSSTGTQNAQWTVLGSPWSSNGGSAAIGVLVPQATYDATVYSKIISCRRWPSVGLRWYLDANEWW